ncbi:hypothetical protein BDF14DRAFT_1868753, partial [Spinellus fusiger]
IISGYISNVITGLFLVFLSHWVLQARFLLTQYITAISHLTNMSTFICVQYKKITIICACLRRGYVVIMKTTVAVTD